MSRLPITRGGRAAAVKRYYETSGALVNYRNDNGGIDPFYDEVEDERECVFGDLA